jgi:anti-sigma regulatory factor (Ser/Thr protein kinase)
MNTHCAPTWPDPSAQILLRATSEESAVLERWTASLGSDFGLPDPVLQRIDLCLVEAMSNVIAYAYPHSSAGTVRICFWREPEGIVIRIDDDGEAFDPTSYPVQALPASLEGASAGGRGIRLMRHYAEEIRYQRDGPINRLTLVFKARNGEVRPSSTLGKPGVV